MSVRSIHLTRKSGEVQLLQHRMLGQMVACSDASEPADVLSELIAMQSQLYAMGKWAIGLRCPGSTEKQIDKLFDSGEILRTHVMRPTWHFVRPRDIKWLQRLTSPRVHQANAYINRKLGLTSEHLVKTSDIIVKALEGQQHLTRPELQKVLAKKKIEAEGSVLAFYVMHAELEGLICSGPRRGKQFTYALIDERAPSAMELDIDGALAEFTLRYFRSRGPATIADFTTWSGLTVKQANQGIASLPSEYESIDVDGATYYFLPRSIPKLTTQDQTYLMPDYDEYGMSYKDRSALTSKHYEKVVHSPFSHWLVVDGKIEGTWERVESKKQISVDVMPFGKLTRTQRDAVDRAVARYVEFHQA